MIKCIQFVIFIFYSISVWADGVDVFGAEEKLSQDILKKYGQRVLAFEKELFKMRSHGMTLATQKIYEQRQENLEKNLSKDFKLSRVKFDSVYYPNKTLYTTINILPPSYHEIKNEVYVPQKPYDIIDKMIFFQQKALFLFLKNPQIGGNLNCKDFHCLTPEKSSLQDDLNYFRQYVPLHIKEINQVMLGDSHITRRRAAIFLLAYYSNLEEVNSRLNQLLLENNRFVLHDCLRVYGEFLKKYPSMHVDLKKIIPFLSSYDEAIRNKALLIIDAIANQSIYQKEIISDAGGDLIKLLKLQQPNNHELAYRILIKVSHQSFAQRDYQAWTDWLSKNI